MGNILSTLKEKGYRLTDEDLDTLVSTITSTDKVSGLLAEGYFNVLQRLYLDTTTHGPDPVIALSQVHNSLYEKVKESVAKQPDVVDHRTDSTEVRSEKARERNRRTNFARTARQTLADTLKLAVPVPEWEAGELVTKATLLKRIHGARGAVPKVLHDPSEEFRDKCLAFLREAHAYYAVAPSDAGDMLTIVVTNLESLIGS